MWVVLATVVVYQIVLIAIGLWARGRAQTQDEYFLGNRTLGPWVASLSYAAGSSSAWTILGVSGIAFTQGLGSLWIVPGTITGHIVVWFWIAPKLQRLSGEHKWLTLTDMLAWQLPAKAAQLTYRLAAFIILFCFTFYVAAQFQGAANTFTAMFNVPTLVALIIGVIIVLLYTLLGGFWAVSVTDALQALLMLFAAIVLPVVAFLKLGGFTEITPQLAPDSSDTYWDWLGGNSGWYAVGMLIGMASIGFGPSGQPHLLNRIMALGSAKDVATARNVALLWFTIVLGGMYFLGVVAHMWLTEPVVQGEQVFFVLAQSLLPPILTGIIVAAVLSAIMSTADSQLLVAASAVAYDLRGGKGQKLALGETDQSHNSGRWAVVLVAVLALLLAMFLPESIFSRVLFAWNALGAAFGPIVVARLLKFQLAAWSVPTAMLLGFGLTVLFYSLPDGPGDIWERAVPFVTAFVTLWVGRTSR